MTKQITFNAMCQYNGEVIRHRITGTLIKIDGVENLKFAVHRIVTTDKGKIIQVTRSQFIVSELSSGMTIYPTPIVPLNKRKAIERAQQIIRKVGVEKATKVITTAIKTYGYANKDNAE